MKKILEINNLTKTYQTPTEEIKAVEQFSIELQKGQFIAIVGPSGCGKSTILSILCGLEDKDNGEIINYNQKIGYMPQTDALFEWRTIMDNCLLGLEIAKTKNKDNIKYVDELLNKYGLGEFKNHHPSNLSGGMRQRVACIKTIEYIVINILISLILYNIV